MWEWQPRPVLHHGDLECKNILIEDHTNRVVLVDRGSAVGQHRLYSLAWMCAMYPTASPMVSGFVEGLGYAVSPPTQHVAELRPLTLMVWLWKIYWRLRFGRLDLLKYLMNRTHQVLTDGPDDNQI